MLVRASGVSVPHCADVGRARRGAELEYCRVSDDGQAIERAIEKAASNHNVRHFLRLTLSTGPKRCRLT
jgi:hypothetical protein